MYICAHQSHKEDDNLTGDGAFGQNCGHGPMRSPWLMKRLVRYVCFKYLVNTSHLHDTHIVGTTYNSNPSDCIARLYRIRPAAHIIRPSNNVAN